MEWLQSPLCMIRLLCVLSTVEYPAMRKLDDRVTLQLLLGPTVLVLMARYLGLTLQAVIASTQNPSPSES